MTVQGLSDELADYFNLPAGQGVVVADVSDATSAALRRGDVILEVDGSPVHDPAEFRAKLHRAAPAAVDLVGAARTDARCTSPSTAPPARGELSISRAARHH